MEDVIPPHICLHGYADDHSIKDEFEASNRMDETNMIDSLVSTTDDIKKLDGHKLFENEWSKDGVYHICSKKTTCKM